MSRYGKLGKNIALIMVGNFASKMLSFFFIPLYTSVLTTREYGTADLMTTTITLLSPFLTLLISEAVMRFALDLEKDKSQVFSCGIFTTLLGFFVMVACSPLLLLSASTKPYFWYFIFYYFFSVINLLLSQFVKGIEKVEIYTLSGVLQTVCFITLNLVFLLGLKLGVVGYLLALICSNAFASVVLWFGARLQKYLLSPRKIDRSLYREMLRYSIPMIPNSLSWWISNSSDKYLITFFSGIAATGVYSVSQKIPSLFSVVSTIFMGAWQISAVEDFSSKESNRFFSEVYQKYSTLNILLVSFLICGSRILARILFAKDFFDGWIYVPVLLLAFLFFAMSSFLGTIYTSAKKSKMLFVSTIIAAAVNIFLNCMLIPRFNVLGAAVATLISYFLVWIIRLIDTRKIIHIQVKYGKDTISYIIITAQIFLMLSNNTVAFIISAALFVLLCGFNYTFFGSLIQIAKSIIVRKR